jgi:hypothetical protein
MRTAGTGRAGARGIARTETPSWCSCRASSRVNGIPHRGRRPTPADRRRVAPTPSPPGKRRCTARARGHRDRRRRERAAAPRQVDRRRREACATRSAGSCATSIASAAASALARRNCGCRRARRARAGSPRARRAGRRPAVAGSPARSTAATTTMGSANSVTARSPASPGSAATHAASSSRAVGGATAADAAATRRQRRAAGAQPRDQRFADGGIRRIRFARRRRAEGVPASSNSVPLRPAPSPPRDTHAGLRCRRSQRQKQNAPWPAPTGPNSARQIR